MLPPQDPSAPIRCQELPGFPLTKTNELKKKQPHCLNGSLKHLVTKLVFPSAAAAASGGNDLRPQAKGQRVRQNRAVLLRADPCRAVKDHP